MRYPRSGQREEILKRIFLATTILFATLILASCNATPELTMGVRANGTYSNEFFGFTVTYPAGFHIESRPEAAQRLGVDIAYLSDIDLLSTLRTLPLLSAYQTNPSAVGVGELNPRMLITAERVDSGITEADYLLLLIEQLNYLVDMNFEHGGVSHTYIAGRQFYTLAVQGTLLHYGSYIFSTTDIYHTTRIRGYMVTFAFFNFDRELMDQVLNSIEF